MAAAGGKVILGMAGAWACDVDDVKDSSSCSDHYTCKIGGFPDWPPPFLHAAAAADFFISPDDNTLLLCNICQNNLSLLAQVYAPISTASFNIHERVLYVFGCVSPNCGTHPRSWRVLRLQNNQLQHLPPTNAVSQQDVSSLPSPASSVSNKNWWDFDDDDDDVVDLKELGKAFSQNAISPSTSEKQTTNNGHSNSKVGPSPPKPTITASVHRSKPVVPCFYIYTLEEEQSSTQLARARSNCSSLSLKNNQIDNDHQCEDEIWEGETYEYDRALNADRTYLRFKKKMDANPEQCFRYSYGGKPLLATESIEEPEICKRCGEKKHYEMQLMPQVLYFIQEQAKDSSTKQSLENWNWMTLIVYTCSKSCSQLLKRESDNNGWVVAEEAVLLQFE